MVRNWVEKLELKDYFGCSQLKTEFGRGLKVREWIKESKGMIRKQFSDLKLFRENFKWKAKNQVSIKLIKLITWIFLRPKITTLNSPIHTKEPLSLYPFKKLTFHPASSLLIISNVHWSRRQALISLLIHLNWLLTVFWSWVMTC